MIRWEDLVEGCEPAPRRLGPLTRTDFVRYQGASFDMNPVHHDELFARSAGYSAPLAVGMFTAGVMTSWATDWLGPENVRRTRIRWKKPAFPGSVIEISGRVTGRQQQAGERQVDLELQGVDEQGDVAVLVWMRFVVPETS